MVRRISTLVLSLVVTSAAAQSTERLYLGSSALIGSSRLVGLSGAYVGIAEGATGTLSNLAAIAHRDPRREGQWDWDLALSFLVAARANDRDLDNDGRTDETDSSNESLLGFLIQFGRAGLGAQARVSENRYCIARCGSVDRELMRVRREVGSVGLGLSTFRDQLVVGLGFTYGSAVFGVDTPEGPATWTFAGVNLEGGLLVRPLEQPFRVGLALKQETKGTFRPVGDQLPQLPDRALFEGTVTPYVLSVGGSLRLGEGAQRYNRLSRAAIFELPHRPHEKTPTIDRNHDQPPGRVLLAAQVDLVFPVRGATSLRPLTHLESGEPVGTALYVAPRIGVEHETLVKRLRLRGGSYLEPSPFAQRPPRPHLTGGFELFLFRFLDDWAVSFAFDLASRYYNFGFGLGFWR